jgi:chemotaxis response regulator CheB
VIDKCKEAIKAIDRIFNEPTDLAHKLWKSLTTRRAALKSPFETLKANMESRIRAWKQKAETEQRIRQLEETKRQEEKARQERELQSILLDLGGEADIADALLEAPVVTPPVIIADQMPEGLATRDNWKAVVDDLMELARGVAEGKVPLVAIYANQPWLNTQARTHREALKDMIPGVHAVNEEVIL